MFSVGWPVLEVGDELGDELEVVSVGSANATAGVFVRAAPKPSATANAPAGQWIAPHRPSTWGTTGVGTGGASTGAALIGAVGFCPCEGDLGDFFG